MRRVSHVLPDLSGGELTHDQTKKLDSLLEPFLISDDRLKAFVEIFVEDLHRGLGKATNDDADMKCFPTYVSKMPTGSERGRYLALDLGGTHFRVLLVDLDITGSPEKKNDMKFRTFAIPAELMVGSVYPLFDHIAACVATFVVDEGLGQDRIPLGFTFSFLCRQLSLVNAVLLCWSKGFKCDDGINQNVAKLLSDALAKRKEVNVDCVAVINDTTGTLMSCAFEASDAAVGVIVGTGTNACYVESLSNAEMWSPEEVTDDQKSGILNCEWGAFGNGGSLDRTGIRTDIDRALDAETNNKGGHLFEKLIGGKYLGEITRLILCQVMEAGLIFDQQGSFVFEEKAGREKFETKHLSDIEADSGPSFLATRKVLDELGVRLPTLADCQVVQRVCMTVSKRAATLAGAATACLVNQVGRAQTTVGVDGSVFRFHPTFATVMEDTMMKVVHPGREFSLKLSTDGSGRGAALVAAAAVAGNS